MSIGMSQMLRMREFGQRRRVASATMAAGAVMALGMAVAAWLYPTLGGATYGIGLVFSAVGLGLCGLLAYWWRGGELAV